MFLPFKKCLFGLLFSVALFSAEARQQNNPADSVQIRKIFDEALTDNTSYEQLRHLSTKIGGRLSGSAEAAEAVAYTKKIMEGMNLDRVYVQEVMVPHWVRGKAEQGKIIPAKGAPVKVGIAALGGSVATPKKGLKAGVVEVQTFEELKKLGLEKVKGKIVFFNRPMADEHVSTFRAYSGAVDQRGSGAVEAAKLGAVGVLVRSMSQTIDDFPHTGSMRYQDDVTKIPAAAISTAGAEKLSQLLKTNPNLTFALEMHCQTLPDVLSHNVIGEITGSDFPEEIIVVGGHLDSWDLGQGAHDDGAGCMQAIEVLRLFKELNIKPKRTIRAVMYMNEENGVRGGRKYAELAKAANENHIAAIESDAGGFTPRGFGIDSNPENVAKLQAFKPLLAPYGLHEIGPGYGGVDIGPLRDGKVALIGFIPDSQRYFDYHHAASDTFDKINRRELALGAASMASLVYMIDKYGL